MAVFVLDSNFFIQAHRSHYPLDVAVGFWNKIKQLADQGKIISIDKVKEELYGSNDDLEKWCKVNLPIGFFKDSTTAISEYANIVAWAQSNSGFYQPNALIEFLSADEADAFLIAYTLADAQNRTIVTHEISQPNMSNSSLKRKIKIPDVCGGVGVRFVNTIEMFRRLGEWF